MNQEITPNPKVFISYSHDSLAHSNRILAFSDKMRGEGIDCILDQYEESPPEGWPRWMLTQLEQANYVLIFCTENYHKRFIGKDQLGKGRGAKWEGTVITQNLYEAESNNTKFIPVILTPADQAQIPIILRGTTHYVLEDPKDCEKLYRRLTGQHDTPKPPLGDLRTLTPKERKQNFFEPRGTCRMPATHFSRGGTS